LNTGCSLELDGLDDASDDEPGVDLECDPYDLGEEDLENGPSLAEVPAASNARYPSDLCGGLGSAHDTLGDDDFAVFLY
jgi:hypothetical protein